MRDECMKEIPQPSEEEKDRGGGMRRVWEQVGGPNNRQSARRTLCGKAEANPLPPPFFFLEP